MNHTADRFAKRGRCRTCRGLLLGCVVLLFTGWPRHVRGELPQLSSANAEKLVGSEATLEMDVASLKLARRRQMQFLIPAANFRGSSSLSIAIRSADLKNFTTEENAGLEGRYQNRHVRATGQVVRDEGQILLMVSRPEQIKVLGPAGESPKPAETPALVVVDEDGQAKSFTLPLSEALKRETVRVEHEGETAVYTGVALATLLEKAGVTLGQEARGRSLARYVLVTAQDGYAVVFSAAEVDPYMSPHTVLLAETIDGRAVASKEFPLLVVTGDKRQRRWARQAARIEVRNAPLGATD